MLLTKFCSSRPQACPVAVQPESNIMIDVQLLMRNPPKEFQFRLCGLANRHDSMKFRTTRDDCIGTCEHAKGMKISLFEIRQYQVNPRKMEEWVGFMESRVVPYMTSKSMVVTAMFKVKRMKICTSGFADSTTKRTVRGCIARSTNRMNGNRR